jgi:hypothetical protein
LRLEPLEDRCVPATITPTTFADGGLGSGSLRDAVLQFNADTGTDDDIIQLLPGTYTLTIRNAGGRHETAGLTGDLNLNQTSHRWIIQGAGPSTIIDASQLQDRAFQIVNPGTHVVFQDLVIQGGLAQENGANGAQAGTTDALGGGIFNNGGDVTLDDVILQYNMALAADRLPLDPGFNAQGGGLYSINGILTISSSTIAANAVYGGGHAGGSTFCGGTCTVPAGQGGAGQGGGLYAVGGRLTLNTSTITGNTLRGGNGGNSQLYLGSGGAGGASEGGGLYGNGTLVVTNSVIATNAVRGGDGGTGSGYVFHQGGGNGGMGRGGGLYFGGILTFSNSTISANSLRGGDGGQSFGSEVFGGDGGGGLGGGLWVATAATAQVSFSTVASNQATGGMHGRGDLNGSNGPATGGGLYNQATLQTSDTILARNTVTGPGTNTSPDLAGNLGSLGHNLIGSSQGGSGFNPSDLLNVDPRLGPLQNNGGPTQTMALLPGSPAIDAGDNTGAPMWDQRGAGFPRIIHGVIDIGAFEYRPPRQAQLDPNPIPIQGLSPPGPTNQPLFGPAEQSVDVAPQESGGATVQPDQPDTTLKPARASAALRARDVVLEAWSDPLADVLAGL